MTNTRKPKEKDLIDQILDQIDLLPAEQNPPPRKRGVTFS